MQRQSSENHFPVIVVQIISLPEARKSCISFLCNKYCTTGKKLSFELHKEGGWELMISYRRVRKMKN